MIRSLKNPITRCPASHDFRMPAEWEPHEATWMAWPHFRGDWPGKFEPVPWVYAEIVRHLTVEEKVHILVNDGAAEKKAQKVLATIPVQLGNIFFHRWPTDRVWTRDSGPIFLKSKSGETALTHWKFNAWGKYPNWKHDAKIPTRIAALLKIPSWQPKVNVNSREHPVVLEGGSIDVNGCGTLLTTEECLLSKVQERNPGLQRAHMETALTDHLGIRKIIWLGGGIAGDDTHGHVDDIARFVAPDTVVAAVEKNSRDENYEPLQENLRRLQSATDQESRGLRIIELPMPAPVFFKGRRLPASYANFYIANGLVLVPTFNDTNDRIALNILAELFSSRKVVGIYCGDLIWGFGALHCMTQQQPR